MHMFVSCKKGFSGCVRRIYVNRCNVFFCESIVLLFEINIHHINTVRTSRD